MQTRTKSALLLLAVLVLGMAIGILLSGVMHNRRMDRIARLRTGPGIAGLVERAVEPESEEQRARIRAVMDEAAPRFAEVFKRTREEMESLSDSVMSELETILSADQMEALRRHMDMRMRRDARPSGDRRGREGASRRPGAGGPPPGRPPPDSLPPDAPPPE
jgi:hypothetical protein